MVWTGLEASPGTGILRADGFSPSVMAFQGIKYKVSFYQKSSANSVFKFSLMKIKTKLTVSNLYFVVDFMKN